MRLLRALVLVALPSAAAWAQCQPAALGPCVLDLRGAAAPRLSGSCAHDAWKGHLTFELPERFADADANGWHEVVLQLDLDARRGCSCAVFRVVFAGTPRGRSVNIGDSPTNDGYGGDAWSTRFDAELLVAERDLDAFGADRPGSPAESRIFGLHNLPLADRTLELEVCDQSIRFVLGELNGFFSTYASHELIAIRSAAAPGDEAADARIYAAFNRVIHRRAGRPAHDRFGSGVRRVELSLTP